MSAPAKRIPLYHHPQPEWTEAERPVLPGSPAAIAHATPLRWAYALVAVIVALAGSLGNALVSVNLAAIQGSQGLTPGEGAWLMAATPAPTSHPTCCSTSSASSSACGSMPKSAWAFTLRSR